MKKNLVQGSSSAGEDGVPTSAQSSMRRKTIFASGFDQDKDNSPSDVYPKSADECKRIRAALQTNPILSELDEQTVQQIILAMEKRKVATNEVIIAEGDYGDYFYIVDTGTYEASQMVKNKKVPIKVYGEGGYFGELSLLYDQPRKATVTAKSNGTLWALSQKNFKKTVVRSDMKKRIRHNELIKKVDVLQNLREDERTKLSEALESKSFSKGQHIIDQGETANGMFFVEEGKVAVYVQDANKSLILLRTLKPGEYFGELALLTHQTRAATVLAETDVIVAFLNVEAFERLLGNIDTIMRRNAATYEKQMKKLLNEHSPPSK